MLLSVHQTTMAQSPVNPPLEFTPVRIKCSQRRDAQYTYQCSQDFTFVMLLPYSTKMLLEILTNLGKIKKPNNSTLKYSQTF